MLKLPKQVREYNDEILAILWPNKWLVGLITLGLIFTVVFSRIVVPVFVVIILGVIASYSASYKRIFRVPPAFELVTFTTVIVALAYGPVVGAIYGAIVTLIAEIMTSALDVFIFSFVPSRAIVGLTAGFFFEVFNGSFVATVVMASLMYNLMCQPMYLFMADLPMRMKALFFVSINIGLNFITVVLFGKFAIMLLNIL